MEAWIIALLITVVVGGVVLLIERKPKPRGDAPVPGIGQEDLAPDRLTDVEWPFPKRLGDLQNEAQSRQLTEARLRQESGVPDYFPEKRGNE